VNIRLIDKAADVGGTWYFNRYPGLACDVESYVYMPLLEGTGYLPTEKYAKGPEIFAHCRLPLGPEHQPRRCDPGPVRVDGQRLSEQTEAAQHPRDHGVQRVAPSTPADGTTTTPANNSASSPINASGSPEPERRRSSASRIWRDRRGGCSSFSAPSTVDVRANRPTDPQWAAGLGSGWQRERIVNFQLLTNGGEADEDLVDDAWTSITKKLPVMRRHARGDLTPAESARATELADFAKMEEIRARVDSIVTDSATAEALKPWYGYYCKRPCFHDEYLQAFNRDNVTLVDTRGLGVERITANVVVVDGVEYELDCLIFATGFEVGTDYLRRTGLRSSVVTD
jgi:hypothetical protein